MYFNMVDMTNVVNPITAQPSGWMYNCSLLQFQEQFDISVKNSEKCQPTFQLAKTTWPVHSRCPVKASGRPRHIHQKHYDCQQCREERRRKENGDVKLKGHSWEPKQTKAQQAWRHPMEAR